MLRRGDGSRTIDMVASIRIVRRTRLDGGVDPVGNIVSVMDPRHFGASNFPFGVNGGRRKLIIRVNDVPDHVAWVEDPGQKNGIDSVLLWPGSGTLTRRYMFDTTAFALLPGMGAYARRGMDPERYTPPDDVPELAWAVFRGLLMDRQRGGLRDATDTVLAAITRVGSQFTAPTPRPRGSPPKPDTAYVKGL